MPVPTSRDAFAGTKTRIKKIIERLATIHPDAKPDLDFSSALELLIALILAAQARDELIRKSLQACLKNIGPPKTTRRHHYLNCNERSAESTSTGTNRDQFTTAAVN